MNDKIRKSLQKLSDDIGSELKTNHAENAILAALAAIPGIGGILASLLSSYANEYKKKRILGFIGDLSKAVHAIVEKVDREYIQKEEFLYIFEQVLKGVAENYHEEKIRCFKNILLNSLTNPPSISQENREVFINLTNSLSVRHIRILKFLFNPKPQWPKFMDKRLPNVPLEMSEHIAAERVIDRVFPEYTGGEVLNAIEDMQNLRLVSNFVRHSFMALTVDPKRLQDSVTSFARKFIIFLSEPS